MVIEERCVMCNRIATKVAEENSEPLCDRCYLTNSEARYTKYTRKIREEKK